MPNLSSAQHPINRRIHYVLSSVERIGKGAKTAVWQRPDATLAPQSTDYIAAREYLVCIEAGNLAVYDMDVSKLHLALRDQKYMRSVGYHVTVITMGCYDPLAPQDEEQLLSSRLNSEIAQFIDVLAEPSEALTAERMKAIANGSWRIETALPSLVKTLGTKRILKPANANGAFEAALLGTIGTKSLAAPPVAHKVEIGLALPEHKGKLHWIYLVKGENTMSAFENALATCLGSLAPDSPRQHHMLGHGRWTRPEAAAEQSQSAELMASLLYRSPSPELRPR